MKKTMGLRIGFVALVGLLSASAYAAPLQAAKFSDFKKYFGIRSVWVQEINENDLSQKSTSFKVFQTMTPSSEMDGDIAAASGKEEKIDIEQIINLGKKAWEVVKENRPVVNYDSQMANALPEGVRSWQSLSGWQSPTSKVFRVVYENLYGMDVVDFSFRVLFTPGGKINGKGNYLTHVTIVPANLSVIWGYTFNAKAQVYDVVNVGFAEDPIAGIELMLNWKVDTVLNHEEGSVSYFVRGDGQFRDLSSGN